MIRLPVLMREGLVPGMLGLGWVAGMCSPSLVLAQAADGSIEEVVVTARKREERLIDIPISINVISENNLEKSGAESFTDLLNSVPSLTAFQNGPGRSKIVIRGVSTGGIRNDQPQNKETVGLYIDEVPISVNGFNPESGIFDVERVEVLRGPQGTLYGAGSMTGTVRLITHKPDVESFSGKAETSLSTTKNGGQNLALKGLVNIPLIEDTLALRASVYGTDFDGYLDNVVTGQNDVNQDETQGGRVALRYFPTEDLTLDFSVLYHRLENSGGPTDLGNFTRNNRAFDGFDDELKIYNATASYEFESMQLVSSTSYMDKENTNRISLEYILNTALGLDLAAPLVDTTDIQDFSQEIRLSSTGEGPMQWVAGVYFNARDRFYGQEGVVDGFDQAIGVPGSVFGAPADNVFSGFQNVEQEQVAVFGEFSYTLDQLTATFGLRWFDWKQTYGLRSSGIFNGGVTTRASSAEASGINPKLNLSYAVDDDTLLYAQAAKGFRFGGVNNVVPTDLCAEELAGIGLDAAPDTFDEDSLWNYELGIKGALPNNKGVFNLAYFYIDWSEIQTTRSLGCNFSYTENADEVVSQGVELDLTLQPSENLSLNLGGSYTDASLAKDAPNIQGREGDHVPYVPAWSLSASGEYTIPVSDTVNGFVWAGYRYIGRRDTEFNTQRIDSRVLSSYNVVDLRAGVQFGRSEISIFANNAGNSVGVLNAIDASASAPESRITIRPRTVGLTARTSF